MSSLHDIILGPKEPNPEEPKYKKMQEQAHSAGVKAAERLKLGKGMLGIQTYAEKNPKIFLGTVLTFVVLSVLVCAKRVYIATHTRETNTSAVKTENIHLHKALEAREKRLHPEYKK